MNGWITAPASMRALAITQLRADAHAVAELDPALEDAVDVDLDVAAACELAAHVEARRVGQPHAGLHQRLGAHALIAALQIGELRRAVHAQHLGLVGAAAPRPPRTPSATAMATMSVR